jgi:NAD(P)-dependent dehydrogenase (short-subunit alcohol dehydrogenase family)
MDLGIDGDTALITGSSSGLGKASARALARDGANIVINGRDQDHLDAAVAELRSDTDANVLGVAGDLTDPNDIEGLVTRTIDAFGGIDHLVTSVGGPPAGSFLETDDRDWYRAYDALVMSVVRLVRRTAPALRADGGGTVVTITSRSVKEAIENLVLSNAVRMSVVGLEKTLSQELAPDVRANAVLPGTHETDRIREIIGERVENGEYDSYEEGLADWQADIPLERIGDPIELGRTVAFLSSPASSYINGAAVPVDGGQSASNL